MVPEGSWVLTPKTGPAVFVFVCQDVGAHVCQRERNKESETERRYGADAILVGKLKTQHMKLVTTTTSGWTCRPDALYCAGTPFGQILEYKASKQTHAFAQAPVLLSFRPCFAQAPVLPSLHPCSKLL